MDLFRFSNPTAPTKMERGIIVDGADSKMWVERYSEDGEFEVEGPVNSGLMAQLPIGSFVSHVASDEIMMVENHEIQDDEESEQTVKISGSGFESFFQHRIVGSDRSFPTTGALPEYLVPSNPTWLQIVYLIRNHIEASELIDDNNAIPYFQTETTASGDGELEERKLSRKDLYSNVKEILQIDDLGIKVLRPGRTGGLASNAANSVIVIHRGVDRSSSVIFSYDSGDVESAEYLWSIKDDKNAAYIHGKWVDTVVFVGPATSGFNRRWMVVDASDMDQDWQEAPTGTARAFIVEAMKIRGRQELATHNKVALAKVDISEEMQSFKYRTDYKIGDFVTVTGNFSEDAKMRVTEHVEIEDSEGTRSYPTLTLPEEDES